MLANRLSTGMRHVPADLSIDLLARVVEIVALGFQRDGRADRVFEVDIGL